MTTARKSKAWERGDLWQVKVGVKYLWLELHTCNHENHIASPPGYTVIGSLVIGGRVVASGYSSCLVCLFGTGESGCHGTAFTAWIAFTQQVINFNSGSFIVE